MQEIYILNKGDSIEKIEYEYGSREMHLADNTILGKNYVVLDKGSNDIKIVRNYLPKYLYRLEDGENIIDVLSRGFEVHNGGDVESGDTLVLNRPSSIRYTVKPLESLDDISEKFGVDRDILINNNKLATDKLFVGQIIWV